MKKTSRKEGKVNPVSVDEGKVIGRKKAEAWTIWHVTKITLGKKAGGKMKDKNKDKILEEENELDFKEERGRRIEWKEDWREEIANKTEEVADKVYVLVLLGKPTEGKDGKESKFQRYQKYCFYCQHNPDKAPSKQKTSWHCQACVGSNGEVHPLCAPSTGWKYFQMHIVHGLPQKRRHTAQG